MKYLFLLLFGIGSCFAAEDTGWIADQNGCKHFNSSPKQDESVTWSGDCKEGFGSGAGELKWYKSGVLTQVLQVSLLEGKANGKGKLTWANGRIYEGGYVNGHMTGSGVKTWPNGDRYEGDFVDGRLEGQGQLSMATGSIYKGGFLNGKKDGYGVYYMNETGNTYEGMFKESKANGKGALIIGTRQDDAGFRYEGNFIDNELSGTGVIIYPNGHQVLCIFVHSQCRF